MCRLSRAGHIAQLREHEAMSLVLSTHREMLGLVLVVCLLSQHWGSRDRQTSGDSLVERPRLLSKLQAKTLICGNPLFFVTHPAYGIAG